MAILTLIAKKREVNDGISAPRKWINFSTLRKGKWYNVKFVKDCAAPQCIKVADGVVRAFIELTPDSKYDVSPKGNGTLFVESYNPVTGDTLEKLKAAETEKVNAYRAKRERERMDFINDDDTPSADGGDDDFPF